MHELQLIHTPPVPGRLLPRQFYSRDALEVARDLLGQEIWHGGVGLRITEVEAYRYPGDRQPSVGENRTNDLKDTDWIFASHDVRLSGTEARELSSLAKGGR